MRAFLRTLSILWVGLFTLALSACGGSSSGPTLDRVEITPATATVTQGQSVQLSAFAVFTDGSREDVTANVAWTSSNPSAVTVDRGQVNVSATAQSGLQATITARYLTKVDTARITVQPAQGVLSSVQIDPATASLIEGDTQQLTLTARFTDGTEQTIAANQAQWVSSAEDNVTVSSAGLVTAIKARALPVPVTATYQGKTATSRITVRATAAPEGAITALKIEPASTSVIVGQSAQLQAIATYENGATQSVTAQAQWTSANASTVSVGNTTGNRGRITGNEVSSTAVTITATVDGKSATSAVTVIDRAVERIEINPASASVPAGLTQNLSATAVYNDATREDVTAKAQWTSSNTNVATVDNASARGQVTAVAADATPATITAAFGGKQGTAAITVTGVELSQIRVSPDEANQSVPAGFTQQFTATGVFTDNSTRDVTQDVAWISSDTAVATIADDGLMTAVAASQTPVTLTATLDDQSGTAQVKIVAATLQGITVTGKNASFPRYGFRTPFTATGKFSDDVDRDITTQVTWASSQASLATIQSKAGSDSGIATTGDLPGTTKITAALGSVTSPEVDLNVRNANLKSMKIEADELADAPEGDTDTRRIAEVGIGRTVQFKAIGTFGASNDEYDITDNVQWGNAKVDETDAAPDTVATVNNQSPNKGRVVTQAHPCTEGTNSGTACEQDRVVLITAEITVKENPLLGGSSDNEVEAAPVRLKVTDAELVSIKISPATNPDNETLPKGFRRQFTAMGTFTDGSQRDVSDEVTWTSDDSSRLTLSNLAGARGVALGGDVGQAQVVASVGVAPNVIEDSFELTVTQATQTNFNLTPATLTIRQGQPGALKAVATFSDGTVLDVSRFNNVEWTSASPAVVGVTANSGDVQGLAQGASIQITAVGQNSRPGEEEPFSGTASVTVSGFQLVGVRVVPATEDGCEYDEPEAVEAVARGLSRQLIACAQRVGAPEADVTAQAVWSSAQQSVATVGNAGATKGVVTAAAAANVGEQAVIQASYTTDGQTEQGSAIVGIAVLDDVAIEDNRDPAGAEVAVNGTVQFSAYAVYDGMRESDPDYVADKGIDVTNRATWTSSEIGVATITTTGSSGRGLATVQAASGDNPPDTTAITATFDGKTSNAVALTREAAPPPP